jgi:hypothetical protein
MRRSKVVVDAWLSVCKAGIGIQLLRLDSDVLFDITPQQKGGSLLEIVKLNWGTIETKLLCFVYVFLRCRLSAVGFRKPSKGLEHLHQSVGGRLLPVNMAKKMTMNYSNGFSSCTGI